MNIKDNPFFLLGASPIDTKEVLHNKTEEKTRDLPEDVCRNAESILLNPQKRLQAEISWFPGVSPAQSHEMTVKIVNDAENLNYDQSFYNQFAGVSKANALALFLSNLPEISSTGLEIIQIIVCDFCEATARIDLEKTRYLINEDRITSGFPEIAVPEGIQQCLDEQQIFYRKIPDF